MIEINLLPGKKRAAKGAGFSLGKIDIRGALASLRNSVKDPWLGAAVGAWAIVGLGGGAMFVTGKAKLNSAENRLEAVRAEKRRFDVVIAQKRQAERIRDSLIAELTVIQQIDADRYVWPHVLDQITKALPPYTWLMSVSTTAALPAGAAAPPPPAATDSLGGPPAIQVTIKGRTVDIQAYTTFLRQLAQSPWFTDVTPAQSATVIESDRPVTEFDISLKYRVADSLYIRTVPLIQAVR